MIVNNLLTNPFAKTTPTPWKPWYGYLLVLVVVLGLGRYAWEYVRGDEPLFPERANLGVPFTTNAPLGNGTAAYSSAWEEAALLMVAEYYRGARGTIDPSLADATMRTMIALETNRGLSARLSTVELGQFAEPYFGTMRATVFEDPSAEEIAAFIAQGVPVIVPVARQFLGNPSYISTNIVHHYVVVHGYSDGMFVVNDPGITNGAQYQYSADVLLRAMGDWNEENVMFGEKRVLILQPEK